MVCRCRACYRRRWSLIASTGVISGYPVGAGAYPLVVQAETASGETAQRWIRDHGRRNWAMHHLVQSRVRSHQPMRGFVGVRRQLVARPSPQCVGRCVY